MLLGFWVLIGIISFVICEKLVVFANSEGGDDDDDAHVDVGVEEEENFETEINISDSSNNNVEKKIAGYLNLVANGFDNFTHGLAVAGSFVISFRIGILTTIAILLHEIPHEIADFAILLRAGFNPWNAAKAQLYTATIGLLGNLTWWILPFTSGCFINIALTNLLPDLVKEDDPKEAVKQFGGILLGIGVMALVSMFHEG
ncbi:Zinc transporter ZIP13 [Folsomia candida]|uniref:Zinc transporter ZIP13 n=1 Tax=Folsomia candida TaxID=158441 RepID=A0A226DKQ9_FOLCA|nr:Zinc transporter ZIP13 [Folsomia candida]